MLSMLNVNKSDVNLCVSNILHAGVITHSRLL